MAANSDVGAPNGGCYPGSDTIGLAAGGGGIFDSSLAVGAPSGSYSHVDCFRKRFAHRIPVLVMSPYARRGVVLHTRSRGTSTPRWPMAGTIPHGPAPAHR